MDRVVEDMPSSAPQIWMAWTSALSAEVAATVHYTAGLGTTRPTACTNLKVIAEVERRESPPRNRPFNAPQNSRPSPSRTPPKPWSRPAPPRSGRASPDPGSPGSGMPSTGGLKYQA